MKYTRFSELTVGQYQQLYAIHRSDDDELEKTIRSVALLTGKAQWEVEDMPLTDFTKVSHEIGLIFSDQVIDMKLPRIINLAGKKYRVVYNVRKLSTGQYIDFQHFVSQNTIENLHKILACLIVPHRWFGKGKYDGENHEKVAEVVQEMNFLQAHAICVFFSKLWNDSIKALEPYLLREMEKKGMTKEMLRGMNLSELMAGFITPAK